MAEIPRLKVSKGTIIEKIMCKHEEVEELGMYKKIKCVNCGKVFYMRVKE